MNVLQVSIEAIDTACEEFRISEALDIPAIVDSLREIGQMSPVILLQRHTAFVIVCGFRRIHALQQLGRSEVWARILSSEEIHSRHPFELALRDNLSHRQLDPLEKARVIYKLQNLCGIPPDSLIQAYFPLLGLPAHKTVLAGYQALCEIHPGLRRCLLEGSLTLSSIELLAKLSMEEQNDIASLMPHIRLSASLQKKVFGLLEDISGVSGAPFGASLQSPEIQNLRTDVDLSSFQKGEKLHEILHRIRNPRLSQAKERFWAQKNRLGLPGCIRVNSHPFFETNDIRVEFDVSNATRFRELVDKLQEAARSSDLEGLFQIEESNDSL
jgi:hypothetical protein